MTRPTIVLLIVLLVASCGRSEPSFGIVGDSLTDQARAGLSDWRVDAEVGSTLHEAASRIRAARTDQVTVIALGSNDVSRRSRTVAADIGRAIAAAGDHPCLLWVDVTTTAAVGYFADWWGPEAVAFNATLRRVVGHDRVIAWSTHSFGRRWFSVDGLHLNAEGAAQYAMFIESEAERRC